MKFYPYVWYRTKSKYICFSSSIFLLTFRYTELIRWSEGQNKKLHNFFLSGLFCTWVAVCWLGGRWPGDRWPYLIFVLFIHNLRRRISTVFLHNQQLWWLWQISGMPPAREKQPLQVHKTRQDKAEATQGNARQSKAEQRQRQEILSISDADWTQFQQTVKRPHCLILTQEIVRS